MTRLLLLLATVTAAALGAAAAPPARAALPVLRIDAARSIPNEPKVRARLRMPGYRGRIGIEVRGQSSQTFPKRAYAIELRDARGEDRKAPLLGMPSDGDWVLYAPYNDKTLMRNVVAYETARWTGRYAARSRFVELRLDGRYHGVYVLMEKLELGDARVRGEALFEFTFPCQARSKAPSFRTPIKRRPIVWEDPERGDLSRSRARALAAAARTGLVLRHRHGQLGLRARLTAARLDARPAHLAQPRGARELPRRGAVPARLARAPDPLDRPQHRPAVTHPQVSPEACV